jgi:sulfate/thiosulfate transport system substrate-binding protein
MKQLWGKNFNAAIIGGASPRKQCKSPSNQWLRQIVSRGLTASILLGGTIACTPPSPNSNNSAPSGDNKKDVEITLVSFAVTKAAHEAVIPKFIEKWQKEHNQKVTFKQSYGGSGSQTRAVIDGLAADVVHLALASDVSKIEQAGLIQPGWEKEAPNEAIVSKSVATIITREGNPKQIKTWEDLSKDGVKWITANPKTSGGAKWNVLALWGAAIKSGQSEAQAQEFVTKAFKNVPILAKDARESTDVFFKQKQGDALINYENEAILAGKKGEKLPYTVPDLNISIDNPIAVVDKNVTKHGNREVVEAFVKFLYTPEAQREFAKVGFRPVDPTVAKDPAIASQFPIAKKIFTVQDLGGWSKVDKQLFADGGIFDKVQAAIRR